MTVPHSFQRISRRRLLQGLAVSPLLYRAAPLCGEWYGAAPGQPPVPAYAESRYTPHYPARSPLEDVLRHVAPGSDDYVTEGYAQAIEAVLRQWSADMQAGRLAALARAFDPALRAASLLPMHESALRPNSPIRTFRRTFDASLTQSASSLTAQLAGWWSAGLRTARADFEISALQVLADTPLAVRTTVRFDMVADAPDGRREQRTGNWRMEWRRNASAAWTLYRWQVESEERSTLQGSAFVDVTAAALGTMPAYSAQLQPGSDEWRTQLDGASGIDVYGNNGVAAGDFDGDGLDDLYISQPAGLPNRLLRNRGDGTFEDVTERAGVGVLDNTACALFADFRNCGLQDLLVVCGTGPLLFQNRGDGTFAKKPEAFRFGTPPAGTFTSAAVADYDRDGRLDVYFCVYSYYLGLDQYHYPAPYFDARNGPPNFLFHNEGDGTFTDRTAAAGLNAENDRYSFACAWGESTDTGLPDLYVVNDFGRANLYRNRGNGTFEAVSTAAHVEDAGAGMSAAWGDYNNDGFPDLYAANMWSAAGQRVAQQAIFHPESTPAVRDQYRRHARGNALYRNDGAGTFTNVSQAAGVELGRWAWASDFLDVDHDGLQDVYVTNGYITAPAHAAAGDVAERADLSSFFWRQVVGKSPDDSTPSQAYERGWNALNELIRTDHSWSGSERNVLLRNNGDGTFSDVAGLLGLDCIEDSRSFALADIDGDGRLEVILKNRSAPQVRILRNALEGIGDSVVLRLRGARTERNTTGNNRDAIGAAVTLETGELRQTRWVQAGSGFLGQHTKDLLFGLGRGDAPVRATVRWPGGAVQHFDALPRNRRIEMTEGSQEMKVSDFRAPPTAYTATAAAREAPAAPNQAATEAPVQTWLLDPLKAPGFSLAALDGSTHTLQNVQGRSSLLHFWSVDAPACLAQLQQWQRSLSKLAASKIGLLTINVDRAEALAKARSYSTAQRFSFPVLLGGEDVPGIYSLIYRYLYDRRRDLPLPCTLLLDSEGRIVKVYSGPVDPLEAVADARSIPATPAERRAKGLPFPGIVHEAQFTRNDFTYGVAMFQHGYLDQAAESFAQVVAARPDNAEAYYNLGTLNLRRNRPDDARQYLQKTLQLKPNYPEAWNNLGMLAGQQGQMAEAVSSFQQALAMRPAYATALLNLGNAYRRQRDYGRAEEALQHALQLQPDDPEAVYSMGMLYAQTNQPAPAAELLTRAIALRPDYPEARNNLGVLLVRTRDYAGAEAQFTTCIQQVPDFDESYINLARLYLLQGNKAGARGALQQLLQRKPDNAAAKQGLTALDAMP